MQATTPSNATTPACGCANCPGAGCTCGCQAAAQTQPAAASGSGCTCGPRCACQNGCRGA